MPTKSFTAYKLHFTGPLHISDSRDDYGTSLRSVSSDTMYAALTATLVKLGEELPQNGDLGCVISALFPFYQGDRDKEATLFFPKPLATAMQRLNTGNVSDAKKIKRVRWLDLEHLQRALIGEGPFSSDSLSDNLKDEYLTQNVIDERFITSEVLERVTVSRNFESDAKPFYMERIHFKASSGLFFLAEGNTLLIDQALPLLSHEGLGTDKNIGNGSFEFEKTSVEIAIPSEAEYGVSLSTFIPENKSQLESFLRGTSHAYDLSRLGGWISTPPYLSLRKNAIYSFVPGSVFYEISSGVGRVVDLAPKGIMDHPVWRCGKALVLPFKL